MNAQTNLATRDADAAVARRPDPQTPAGLAHQLEKGGQELRKALPGHIDAEKFQRTIITAAQSTPALLRADRQSLLLACMKAAQDGLLPDGREAALVIFNNREKDPQSGQWHSVQKVQYLPMVYGLRKKILQSGDIRDITAKVVYRAEYERGTFLYEEGTERMLRHKPDLLLTDEEATDDSIVAAYSIATYMDGTMSYEVMSRAEINKVRQVSKTGAVGMTDRSGKAIPPKGPWVDWFGEMAKKTVMRRHAKTLPMSGDILDVEGREDDDALLAASTRNVLAIEPDKPTALPSADELQEEQGEDDTPAHDPDTGEIIDTATDDNPTAAEGRTDEQHGDQHDGTEQQPADEPQSEPEQKKAPAKRAEPVKEVPQTVDEPEQPQESSGDGGGEADIVDDLVQRFDRAQNVIDLKAVHANWTTWMPQLSDFDNDRCDAAHLAAKDRLGIAD